MPTCLHFPSKNPPKSLQESISKGIKISIDVQTHFFSILAPSWTPEPPKMPPRRPPRRPQVGPPKRIPRALFRSWPPRAPQDPPGPPWDPSKIDFWDDFGGNLAAFCHPKCTKNNPRSHQKLDAILMPTCLHF